MITEKQMKIFLVFAKHPFAELTRKQIKTESGEKSNNALALAISRCTEEGVLKEKKIGRSGLLSLDLENDTTHQYIALANVRRTNSLVQRAIRGVKLEIGGITKFYSLVIFGSFAVEEQQKSSDLDIAIFIETEDKQKRTEATLRSASQKSPIPLDFHVITESEFIEMLTNDEENLGKQIARKHLVVTNPELFYGLVREGIKRGFHP